MYCVCVCVVFDRSPKWGLGVVAPRLRNVIRRVLTLEERAELAFERAKYDRAREREEAVKAAQKGRRAIISFAPEVTFVYGAAQ